MYPHYKPIYFSKKAGCYFCKEGLDLIDYKDTKLLEKYLAFGRIVPASFSNTCAKHQRRLAKAIKRARQAGLMEFIQR